MTRSAGRAWDEIAKIGGRRRADGEAKEEQEDAELDRIFEEITTDAYGDDECYGAFLAVLEDELGKGCDANGHGRGRDMAAGTTEMKDKE